MGKYYENNVQLLWRGDMVAFIKGWSEFARKSEMSIDEMVVFTPMDDGFDLR
jgi:hypothetical protein